MKKSYLFLLVLVTFGLCFSFLSACGDDDDDDDDDSAVEEDDDSSDEDDDDSGDASCTLDDLCAKGVECGQMGSVEECEQTYETLESSCADFDGLFACGCDCLADGGDCPALLECAAACTMNHCL